MKPFKFKDWIKNNKDHVVLEVLRYAKERGVLEIDSYEHPSTSLDLNGQWTVKFNFKGLLTWAKAIYQWIATAVSMSIERGRFFQKESLKSNWDFFLDTHPFKTPWTGWVWTLNSLDYDVEEFFEVTAYEIVSKKQNKEHLDRRRADVQNKYKTFVEKEKSILRKNFSFTSDDFLKYMLDYRGLVPVGNIWLNVNDPTVFYVDKIYCPYDDPKGWSKDGVAQAMKLWLNEAGINLPVVVKDKNNPLNLLENE